MKYGWNIETDLTFGDLSRDFYYANSLVDNIMAENLTEVRKLLETKKANPNTVIPELGVAPLHLLAGLKNEDFSTVVTLQAILRSGGDPNVRSEEGLTPVHVAAMWGRCKVLDVLLANGGDPQLIDYKMFLNAEEYALREQQWKAYRVLSTFSVMAEGGYKMDAENEKKLCESEICHSPSKMLNNKNILQLKTKATNCSDTNSSTVRDSENSCRYSNVRKKKKNKKRNLTDDESSDQSDWSKNTIKILNINGALNAVKKQYIVNKHRVSNTKQHSDDELNSNQSDCSRKDNQDVLNARKRPPDANKGKQTHDKDKIGEEVERDNRSKSTVNSLKLNDGALRTIRRQRRKTNIYESLEDIDGNISPNLRSTRKEQKETSNKLSLYGDNVSESCDWIRKSLNSIKLDKNALNTIRNQRLSSKIYQTKGIGEDPLKERKKEPPLYEESEVQDWVDPRRSESFDEIARNKINIHTTRSATYKSEDPTERSTVCHVPKLPKRNKKPNHRRREDSEMYLCRFTEESIRTNNEHSQRPRDLSSGLSDINSSDFDERGVPNQRMLCKMSRIFLFMLKKRHIYQKIR